MLTSCNSWGLDFPTSASSTVHQFFALLCVCVCVHLVARSCPTLCNAMDCSLWGSYVRGIFQARILEWVAISFSRGSFHLRDWTHISCLGRQVLYHLHHKDAPLALVPGHISKTQISLWSIMCQFPWQTSLGSPLPYLNAAVFQVTNLSSLSWFSLDRERVYPECCPLCASPLMNSSLASTLESDVTSWQIPHSQLTLYHHMCSNNSTFFVLIYLYYTYAFICLLPGFWFYLLVPYLPQRRYIVDVMDV